MAEAAVETPPRFFCHKCNVEINIPPTDFTCPFCAGGFVEELPANAPVTSSSSSTSNNEMPSLERAADLEAIRGEIATFLMSRNGPNVEISIDPGSRRGNLLTMGGGTDGAAGSSTSVLGGGRVRPHHLDRLDNVLMDFLQTLTQGGTGGDVDMESGPWQSLGGNHLFFMGNPGDYAWGREGIDAIVTQLLNQMETSGPPPLAKDKIAEIPKVSVTEDDVCRKLHCSVCWEDFILDEQVRKLPCTHIYHENCIVPWLDLHGTCPICRKSLTEDESEEETGSNTCPLHRNASQNMNAVRSPLASMQQQQQQQQQRQQSTATTPATTTNNTSHQAQNNVFGFDDDNVDLD